MPAVSRAQLKFMRACVNNPESMKGECPPKSIAKKYSYPKKGRLPKHAKGKSLGKE